MHVIAFATAASPEWRWRILNNAGEVIEESRETYETIAMAVAEGSRRLVRMNVTDTTVRRPFGRSTSHLRGR
jgi:hypothetical protein